MRLENWRPKGLVGSNPTPSVIEDQCVEPTRFSKKIAKGVRAEEQACPSKTLTMTDETIERSSINPAPSG